MDTWNKKVKVSNKNITKKSVRDYYKKLWKSDKTFRETIKKKGLFVRASFNGKPIIRRKHIKVDNWNDLEELIKNHAVEFHTKSSNVSRSYIDVDIPKSKIGNKKSICSKIINALKKNNVKIKKVTDSPSGVHIFTTSNKKKLIGSLKELDNNKYHIGKTSKDKIILDPHEPNVAIPRSLSIKGKPYRKR